MRSGLAALPCVIFDLDGTLVDSEGLCNQAFLDLLPDLDEPVSTLVDLYRGRRFSEIVLDLETRLGRPLPPDFERCYRARVAALFATDLKPTPGTVEMLEKSTFPRCVASSGPRKKIEHAIFVSGLSKYFSDRIFSAYEVGSWKPAPDLFLHAAAQMGFSPHMCVVVEDSDVGVAAAQAAGMRVLYYAPARSAPDHNVDGHLQHMSELPGLVEGIAARITTGCSGR